MKPKYAILSALVVLSGVNMPAVARSYFGMLPIPSVRQPINPESVFYYLPIKINGNPQPHSYPVQIHHDGLYMDASILEGLHIHCGRLSGLINVSRLPKVAIKLNSKTQTLLIKVPAEWLPKQNVNIRDALAKPIYHTDTGLILNYRSFYQYDTAHNQSLATSLNARLFGQYGFLVFSGVLNGDDQQINQQQRIHWHFIRNNLSWEYDDAADSLSMIVGDSVTQGSSWYTPVRIGGLSLFKNYQLRPDIQTYPLPIIKGTAAVPSAVQLFMNGEQISSHTVNSGPFALSNIPFINGAGDATLVTTDQLGHVTTTTIPLYDSNQLMKRGIASYDINLGKLRYNFGSQQSQYRHWVMSGSYKKGITNDITAQFHVEAAKNLFLVGAGGNIKLAGLGIMNVSLSNSTQRQAAHYHNGQRFNIGYTYDNQKNHFSVQYTAYSRHFGDLASYGMQFGLNQRSNEQFIYSHTFSGGESLAVALFHIKNSDNTPLSMANLSFSISHIFGGELLTSVSRSLGKQHDVTAMLDWSFALGEATSGSFDTSYNGTQPLSGTINLNHSVDSNNQLGWSLAYSQTAHQKMGYKNIALNYPTDKVNLQGGIYGTTHYQSWLEASGSLVFMHGQLSLTQNLGNAFLMVNTHDVPDVPYYYDNMYQGKTDSTGIGFISNIVPNTPSEIDIDPSQLPANIAIGQTHKATYVKAGTGAMVQFDLQKTSPVLLRVVNAKGNTLPVGSLVYLTSHHDPSFIGYHGQLYLQDGNQPQLITIDYGNGQSCQLNYQPKKSFTATQTVYCLSE